MKLFTNFLLFKENTRATDNGPDTLEKVKDLFRAINSNNKDKYDITYDITDPREDVEYNTPDLKTNNYISIAYAESGDDATETLDIKFDYEYILHKEEAPDNYELEITNVSVLSANYNGKDVTSLYKLLANEIEKIIMFKYS